MKPIYRIAEKKDISGETIFVPQYRKYFIWWNFMQMDVFPKIVTFYSLNRATKFVHSQINRPQEKYHYF